MATNTGNSNNPQLIAIRCTCGKSLAALPHQAGKRVKCPACGQAVIVPTMASPQPVRVAQQIEDKSQGTSRKIFIAMWSFVAVFTLVCVYVVFMAWHSYSSHRANIFAANDRVSKAIAAANEWMASKSFVDCEAVEKELTDALADTNATEKQDGDSVLNQVRKRRAEIKVALEKRQKAEHLAAMERHRQEELRQAQEEERRKAQDEEQRQAQEEKRKRVQEEEQRRTKEQEEEQRRANEPFDLKGDRLGMSLEAFKAKYSRSVKGHNENAPFCSDTRPGKEISTLLSEPWHISAGIINCSIAFPFEKHQPSIAEVETKLLVDHFVDGKLYRITAWLPHDGYRKVKEGLIAKHGVPKQQQTNTFQNRMGATFTGELLVWENSVSTIMLIELFGDLDTSALIFQHRELSEIVAARTPKPTGKDL